MQRAHRTRKEFNKARNTASPASEPKAPDFLAWHVANKGDKAYWTKVGVAWFHRDRKGLSLQMEVIPINGRIVLRTPLDESDRCGQESLSRFIPLLHHASSG